jgi:hypothetical protein
MLGSYWVAAHPLASRVVLSSIYLVYSRCIHKSVFIFSRNNGRTSVCVCPTTPFELRFWKLSGIAHSALALECFRNRLRMSCQGRSGWFQLPYGARLESLCLARKFMQSVEHQESKPWSQVTRAKTPPLATLEVLKLYSGHSKETVVRFCYWVNPCSLCVTCLSSEAKSLSHS